MNNIKKLYIKNFKIILYYAIYLISACFLYEQLIIGTDNNNKAKIIFIFLVILGLLALTFLNRVIIRDEIIHKTYLTISVCFGLIYMLFIPAVCGTDELPHFLRAYQISVGDIVVKEQDKDLTIIPEDLLHFSQFSLPLVERYSKDNILKKVDYNKMTVIYHGDVASAYPPIPYLPQIIGMKISKILKLSPVLTMYCVRFFNFLSWILLTTLAIKKTPIHKKTLSVFLTAPAVLSLVSTSNMDTMSLGLIILLICYIFKYKYDKTKLEKKDKIIIAIISLLFSSYKLFYLLLLSILFFLPYKCFNNKKEKYIYIILLLFGCLLVDFIWYYLSMNTTNITGQSLGAQQIDFILKHPFYYIYVILNSYISGFYYYFTNLFGGHEMCYMKADLNEFFIITYIILFIYILLHSENKNIKLSIFEKTYIILLSLTLIVLVSTSLYVGWTVDYMGVGSSKILGVQSRYYFALVPLIIFLFKNKNNKCNDKVYSYTL